MATRTRAARLDPEERRAQLIELGVRMLSSETPERVPVDEIAEAAGISRGLLFHYFPTKRDFFIEIVHRQVREVGELTVSDPSLSPLDDLRVTVDAYIAYVEENAQSWVTVHRAGIGSDAEVRALLESSYASQVERILGRMTGGREAPPVLELAVQGWLGFAIATMIEWLEHRQLEPEALRELLVYAMKGAVAAACEADPSITLAGLEAAD